jgi:hypothetical protein
MDERAIKRLLIMLVASIIAIWLIKVMLTKSYTNLNNAAAAKKQAESAKLSTPQQPPAASATEIIDTPAASSVGEVTAVEISASSSLSETR